MAGQDIITIGSSAGGIAALQTLFTGLAPDLPAAVFVVQHLSPDAASLLPQILGRAGPLPVGTPADGEAVQPGRAYVAPPDRHMLLRDNHILLRRGPPENRARPAIDALFRSAAITYGPRVVGVVLTGLRDDGTEGLIAIKNGGGTSVVQDPVDAAWPAMPRHALARAPVDHCAKLIELPALLGRLARERAGPAIPLPAEVLAEARIAEQDFAAAHAHTPGRPSPFSCPDCGGVLNEIASVGTSRFRCQVGHAFTAAGLAEAQDDELERALSVAVRTHRDRLTLFRRMQEDAVPHAPLSAARWGKAAEESEHLASVLERAAAALRRTPDPTG